MNRDIEQQLVSWKQRDNRLPVLLRGARQVGKTYIIEKLGREHFKQMLTINFEAQPELRVCFETLEPQTILTTIELLTQQTIKPGETLLFLDEIQECPSAILALRYFKEKMPALHVIGAGSLLEFTLNDKNFRMPVGRVQSLYLKPLSFIEYLSAAGYQQLRDYLSAITLQTPVNTAIHQHLLKLVREYMILGGMPAVIQEYLQNKNLNECQQIQSALLNSYRYDFGKYAPLTDHQYLQRLFEKAPGLIAKHFQYVKVDPDMRSRDIKTALQMLRHANLIYLVYSTASTGIPLISLINEKKFKLLFLDVGLVQRADKLATELLLENDLLLVNRGALAEQFVGQELLAYSSCYEEANLYFWSREKKSSLAEVDYVTTVDSKIIPIEVKAGTTGQLKSLKIFMAEKNIPLGIRISQAPLNYNDGILSLPLYLIHQLPRLVNDICKQKIKKLPS